MIQVEDNVFSLLTNTIRFNIFTLYCLLINQTFENININYDVTLLLNINDTPDNKTNIRHLLQRKQTL